MATKTMQEMVLDFHRVFRVTVGEAPKVRDAHLRAKLIMEEATETCEVESIDGMCDVLYVIFGTAIACGVELTPFFAEVHRSNMTKIGGAIRADGKILKPPTWTPPDIAGILNLPCPHGRASWLMCPHCKKWTRFA